MWEKLKENNVLLKYIPIILLFPVALNFILFSFDLGISYGDGDVWLSFWGNYTGGLISALVAYLVANSQIERQTSRDSDQRQFELAVNQLPALIRSRIELEKIIPELEKIKKENDNFTRIWSLTKEYKELEDKFKPPTYLLLDSLLRNMFFHVELIDKEVLKTLEKVENVDLQIELINAFSFYEKFSKGLTFNFELAQLQEKEFRKQIKNNNIDTNMGIETQLFNLEMEMKKALNERREGIRVLYTKNKIEDLKETLSRLNDEIESSIHIKLRGTAKG